MYNYILTFDFLAQQLNLTQLSTFIRVNRAIDGWHSPYAGTFILKSSADIHTLQKDFIDFFGATSFVLVCANAGELTGVLPKTVWDWVNSGLASVAQRLSRISGETLGDALARYATERRPPPPNLPKK